MYFLVLALTLAAAVTVRSDELLVKLEDGSQVQGHVTANTRVWQGLPYAKPPVKDLRWQFPQPPEPLDGIYEANVLAPGCPQVCHLPYGSCQQENVYSEDCLYLNVYAPSEPSPDPEGYPVFYWVHGGAYSQGLGNCALYNGTYQAQRGVISVVINYRLGALGFLASASMQGNYGTMDQIQGLKWVQANIAGFGGDPSRVTVAGQSAGGESVATLMVAQEAKGLFAGAIMESYPLSLPLHTRESAAKNAKDLFEYLDCDYDDLACLQTKTADQIVEAQKAAPKLNLKDLFVNFLPFSPMADPNQGPLRQQVFDSMAQGAYNPVPLLAGSVSEEGWLFVMELFPDPLSKVAYEGSVRMIFGRKASKQVLKAYPFDLRTPDETDGRNPLSTLGTDLLFYCPLRNVTRGAQSQQGNNAQATFLYRFKHLISADIWEPTNPYCVGHVCHASEVPFVWNVWDDGMEQTPPVKLTDDEVALDNQIISAWMNMVKFGNPNGDGKNGDPVKSPGYAAYDSSNRVTILDYPDNSIKSNLRDSYCDMWDSLGYFY